MLKLRLAEFQGYAKNVTKAEIQSKHFFASMLKEIKIQ